MIIVLVVGVMSVSYVTFQYTKTGTKVNSITSGILVMNYRESDNFLSMDKALPTTDATRTKRLKDGEYFDFIISGTIQGDAMINWDKGGCC